MKKRVIIIVILILILLLAPYIKVEYLTSKYGDSFSQHYQSIGMFDDVEYFKVMTYSKDHAEVLYILPNKAASVLALFSNNNGSWMLESWSTIWSTSGSANSFIWPYYR